MGGSLLCYAIACALPCIDMTKSNVETWYGVWILLIGWMGILVGQFAWLANVFWAAGVIFFALRRWTIAGVLSALALLLAMQTFTLIVTGLPGDEGGVTRLQFLRFRFGFYLWLTSFLVLFAGILRLRRPARQHTPQPF